jgi:hypothetical protein
MGKRWLILAIGVMIAVGAYFFWFAKPTLLSELPVPLQQVVEGAQTVQAYRIQSIRQVGGGIEFLEPPKRISGPVSLTETQVRSLRSGLKTRGRQDFVNACKPIPGVEYVFSLNNSAVVLDLCFTCDTAIFQDSHGAQFWSNLTPARHSLVRLMKEIFPHDAQVQSLKESSGAGMLEEWPNTGTWPQS